MEELKNVVAPFYERLRRPFIGAYAIAWFFLNWKLWTALFFYDEVVNGVDKISFIQCQLSHTNTWCNPLWYSLSFLLITPIFDLGIFAWQEWFRSNKRKIKFHLEGITPVEPKTHRRLISEKEELEQRYTNIAATVQTYQDENRELKENNRIFRRSNLNVNDQFFHGNWVLTNSEKFRFSLRITEGNKILLIKHSKDGYPESHLLYSGVQWENTGRSILLLLRKEEFDSKTYDLLQNYSFDLSIDEFKSLLYSNAVCCKIDIDRILTNQIFIYFEPNGPSLNLSRNITNEPIPKLWKNDFTGEFQPPSG